MLPKSFLVVLSASFLLLSACASAPRTPAPTATVEATAENTPAVPEYGGTSTPELERLVAQGNIKATVELGARYGTGRGGVEKNYEKAITLLRTAAEHNDPVGEYLLGTAYYSGAGVPKDEAIAAQLFERSADQHYALAAFWMGFMITNGRGGISPTYAGAIPYLWDAASQGNSPAALMLGYAYDKGSDVDRNPKAAAYWYRKAFSTQRNVQAEYNLVLLIKQGEATWQQGDPPLPAADAAAPAEPKPKT